MSPQQPAFLDNDASAWVAFQGSETLDPDTRAHCRGKLSLGHRLQRTLKPQGPGSNDRSRHERWWNVFTSAPFLFVGYHTLRQRDSLSGKRFGASFMGVGLVAALYHATSGPLRCCFRKLDYWSIAVSTTCMRHNFPLRTKPPALLELGLLALTPVKPTLVTGVNMGIAEVHFSHAAIRHPHLRPAWASHVGLGTLAMACFAVEDAALEANFPYMHAAWHCLAAGSMLMMNSLLKHRELQAIPQPRQHQKLMLNPIPLLP